MEKTNVMRLLDQKKIKYKSFAYENDGTLTGTQIAEMLGQDPNRTFKTLVTVGASKHNYVFVLPVNKELDLKKAAKAVKEKNIEMVKAKDLLGLTGYIHGGCSPIGMKKFFTTTIHQTAVNYPTIMFSAGRVGYQVELSADDLSKMIRYQLADIIVED